ncbi:MAG: hypothetical protein RL318_174 [Fibrobacterota bacterium]|jgi:uncharacterized protein (TIGR02145 family)
MISRLCLALAALSIAPFAQPYLTGKVLNPDSTGKAGVTVALSGTQLTTTTDAQGAWMLGSSVGLSRSNGVVKPVAGNLTVEQGRLQVSFSGRDLSGRRNGVTSGSIAASTPATLAARAQASTDTLVYSLGEKVFLRDTLGSLVQTDMVRLFDTTWNSSIVYGYLKDVRDGQTYRTVGIGSQVWMAQNLNFKSDSSWVYENDADTAAKYGRLYQWPVALGLDYEACKSSNCGAQLLGKKQGVCPTGWHVPSDSEVTVMVNVVEANPAVGTDKAATGLRAAGWKYSTTQDLFGFRFLPGGLRDPYFSNLGSNGYIWTKTEASGTAISVRYMTYSEPKVRTSSISKKNAVAVRCLKN